MCIVISAALSQLPDGRFQLAVLSVVKASSVTLADSILNYMIYCMNYNIFCYGLQVFFYLFGFIWSLYAYTYVVPEIIVSTAHIHISISLII